MSSNFVRFQEILNQALAENFTCLTQKLANPPLKSGSSFPNRDPLFIPQTTFVPTFRPHIISELDGVLCQKCIPKHVKTFTHGDYEKIHFESPIFALCGKAS